MIGGGEGAYQHHLKFSLGKKDEDTRDTAADVRLDLAGAHQHLQLEHLVHLVVLVAQVENDTLNNMVMLRTATGIS